MDADANTDDKKLCGCSADAEIRYTSTAQTVPLKLANSKVKVASI